MLPDEVRKLQSFFSTHLLDEEQVMSLFPTGVLVSSSSVSSHQLYLPLKNGRWLAISQEDLTERERYLLRVFVGEQTVVSQDPWYRYLVEGVGKIPVHPQSIQWIHVHHSLSAIEEKDNWCSWVDMMRSLFPHCIADFRLTPYDTIFVLDHVTSIPVKEVLTDTLATMEFDFGMKLAIFVGQIWTQSVESKWSALFQAECHLFRAWKEQGLFSRVLSFGHLFLWGQGKGLLLPLFRSQLAGMIQEQDQLRESIVALWEEGAVVTKAAQKLYIHRNTLQYRLEKWFEVSGLQLRELTDLTVCYQVLLEE